MKGTHIRFIATVIVGVLLCILWLVGRSPTTTNCEGNFVTGSVWSVHDAIQSEGFQQSSMNDVQQQMNILSDYIQNKSTLNQHDIQVLSQYMTVLNSYFKQITGSCSNGNCTNVPKSYIMNVYQSGWGNDNNMQKYIQNTSTIHPPDREKLLVLLKNIENSANRIQYSCNSNNKCT